MAGNKLNTKTKGKEDKNKGVKSVSQNNEEGEEMDFTVLRKPIPTSITGFAQARKIFDLATEELKDLLSNECDLLYECKVCRNIFRSLANFISHKRVYCKEKFNATQHGHFIKINSTAKEIQKIQRTEEGYQESLKQKISARSAQVEDDNDRIPLSKDLTAVYEQIVKTKGVYSKNDAPDVVLQKIPSSSVAVFQNMNQDERTDRMRAQIDEIDNILARNQAILQSDGKFKIESSQETQSLQDMDSVIQISDDDDEDGDVPKCKICDLQFSTQKTLKFHMKYKHLESRLVYPCPDCLEIFSTSWSVYRHLFKVHRKTAAQIRRLRESIQAKAFRMNNPPAFYEKRKSMKIITTQKITEEERLDQENQAWMDNLEGDGEVPRCGGCGRTFERRAALAAHTHTCQPRSRALARRPDAKKIEIQIRKDYNKVPVTGLPILKAAETENKVTAEEPQPKKSQEITEDTVENEEAEEKVVVDDAPMDIGDDDLKSNDSEETPENKSETTIMDTYQPIIRLPFAMQAEKSNLAAFRQRIQADIVFVKLLCKKCDSTMESAKELFEHMANHFKWKRYACKLCNYKHYNFDHLPEHVKTVHKLKGDNDFYFSTVKAIDGTEAMIISKCLSESDSADDNAEANDVSPESRRPSRCSSDSSRLSDDSSSSATLKEVGARKRKMQIFKNNAKRKKDANEDGDDQRENEVSMDKVLKSIIGEGTCSTVKSFEENSSDLDDVEEKPSKRQSTESAPTVTSRRPIRKRTKPKHKDFEYDLSNLLKMEAQGYRDSTTTTKTSQPKKERKVAAEIPTTYDVLNKDCCGALLTMSKKAVDKAAAEMKTASFAVFFTTTRPAKTFARPINLPRIISRPEKGSPKKDTDDIKDSSSTSTLKKVIEGTGDANNKKEEKLQDTKRDEKDNRSSNGELKKSEDIGSVSLNDRTNISANRTNENQKTTEDNALSSTDRKALLSSITNVPETNDVVVSQNESNSIKDITLNGSSSSVDSEGQDNTGLPNIAPKNPNLSQVPLKFRRQSIDIIKNPLINKNITDFTKAGMKTKILVIKPIHRNKDGGAVINAPLKFQTIKLKDPSKNNSDNKQPDQVMVVKVPKVPCASTVGEKSSSLNASIVDTRNNDENTETHCGVSNIATFENQIPEENGNDVDLDENVINEEIVSTADEDNQNTFKDSDDASKSESMVA